MIHVTTRIVSIAVTSVVAFSLWKGLQLVWRYAYKSSLRHLRGPKNASFLLGNMMEIINDENGDVIERWVKEYGETLRFKGLLNSDQLLTADTRATSHILTHNNDYQKSPMTRKGVAEIFGEGLIVVEGVQHRQQRRIMNPAFGPAQIRALTDTFLAKAFRLRDIWSAEIAKESTDIVTGTRINAMAWLDKLTLDIIGLTGFNYEFDALDSNGVTNELSEAFSTIFSASQNPTVFDFLQAFIPALRVFGSAEASKIKAARRTMMEIGEKLLADAKAIAATNEATKRGINRNSFCGRDLLSLLVKANIATDIPESQRLTDKDVIAQVPTFLVAGHETTSTAIAWALYAMTQAPEIQMKLREELLSVDTDTPSMDELMGLPYLDSFAKETFRVHAPAPFISRMAMKDDVIYVDKPFVDRHGAVRDTTQIAKGEELLIPIQLMNRSETIWGPDALEFKPERWNNIPEAVSRIPGVWGHLMTFIGGPRACIGYRFSVVEFKAILFVLVRAFEFELAVPASELCGRIGITRRPVLRNDRSTSAVDQTVSEDMSVT